MEILKLGMQGPAVHALQTQLNAAGFQLTVDSIFGPATQNAVIQFQQQHQLTQDGIVGPATQAALNNIAPIQQLFGIDISHFTSSINWATLPQEVSFVYCKASQGATFKDQTLSNYLSKLQLSGLARGGYHFLTFQDSVQSQVDNFLGCGIDYGQTGVLPPVIDVEWQASPSLNQYIKSNRQQCIDLLAGWLTQVQSRTGRLPMIYTNANFWQEYFQNPTGFDQYLLWTSAYQSTPPPNIPNLAPYTFWQNSQSGKLKSVANPVDTNIFYGSLAQLQQLAQP